MKLYTLPVGRLATNCYIVDDGAGTAAVIDPGAQAELIRQTAEDNGIEIKKIIITHGHFDHTGAAKKLSRMTGAKIYMYETADFAADVYVKQGDVIECGGLSFKVIFTPGHTRDGMSLICDELLFTGDTLFCLGVGRTDLEGGDFDTLILSLKKLAALDKNYTVLPGHEESSTLDFERENNRYMRGF